MGHRARAVNIRNISTVTVRWQVLRLTFPGPVPIIQFWNVTVTASGSDVIVVPSSFPPAVSRHRGTGSG